jgi:hypothetical protein
VSQLTLPQRQQIESLLGQKFSRAAIARKLGVHASTIKREVERNSEGKIYTAAKAHQLSQSRKEQAGRHNQKKRLCRFLDLHSQLRRNARFCISLEERTQESDAVYNPQSERFREKRRRYYNFLKERQRPKRKGRASFRNFRYHRWKKWYDRKVRERNHLREGLRRTARSAWQMSIYRYRQPFRKKPLIGLRLLRYINKLVRQEESPQPLNQIARQEDYRYPCPVVKFYASALRNLLMTLDWKRKKCWGLRFYFTSPPDSPSGRSMPST